MYYTYQFSDRASLSRARYWLARLGFRPDEVKEHEGESTRLSLSVAPSKEAGARLILEAIASADPARRPTTWTLGQAEVARPTPASLKERTGAASPIGWHPYDLDAPADQKMRAYCEEMGRDLG